MQVFALRARRRATGTLTLSPSGVATTLRFGGTSVRAHAGMTLRFRGLPARLRPRRPASLRLRVLSQFGAPVASALVTVTGDGLALTAVTGPGGLAHRQLHGATPRSHARAGLDAGLRPH